MMNRKCNACGTENSRDAVFCESCGERISVICPACNAANPADARFCSACGTGLAELADKVQKRSRTTVNVEQRPGTVASLSVGDSKAAGLLLANAFKRDPKKWVAFIAALAFVTLPVWIGIAVTTGAPSANQQPTSVDSLASSQKLAEGAPCNYSSECEGTLICAPNSQSAKQCTAPEASVALPATLPDNGDQYAEPAAGAPVISDEVSTTAAAAGLNNPAGPTWGRYTVQVGTFTDNVLAERVVSRIFAIGLPAYTKEMDGYILVYAGAFDTKADAEAVANRLTAFGMARGLVVEMDADMQKLSINQSSPQQRATTLAGNAVRNDVANYSAKAGPGLT